MDPGPEWDHEVDALLEASVTAPTYGVNGRELVLRAAARAAAQSVLDSPTGTAPLSSLAPAGPAGPAQREGEAAGVGPALAQALLDAVAPKERASVAYINRAATPRLARQVVLTHSLCLCAFSWSVHQAPSIHTYTLPSYYAPIACAWGRGRRWPAG